MTTNREKAKRWVELHNGKYQAPDGYSHKPTGVARADFENADDAILFIEELDNKMVSSSSNFLDFDAYVVFFQENTLAECLI